LAEDPATRQRYVGVYDALNTAIGNALRGSNPRGGMEVMAREEANFRQAVEWAVADGQYPVAGPMGSTFRDYLERCARFRERDGWVAWLADEAQRAGWTEAAAAAERQAAWSQFTQGQPQEALQRMQALIQRLEQTTEFDPAFQLANARTQLGRMYDWAGAANRAIPILEQAVGQWERLAVERGRKGAEPLTPALSPEYRGEGVRGVPDPARLAGPTAVEDDPQADRDSLGNLANALMAAGRLDEAMATAERCIRIQTRLGNDREIAADLTRSAQILMQQGRYREADERYEAALAAVTRAGCRSKSSNCWPAWP
jgi:tetratricopeptide (TPR) repeat protein